jgi:hypothetical protein
MRAQPRAGTPQYLQGWAPEIDFDDTAKVSALASIRQQALAMDKLAYTAARKVDQQTPAGELTSGPDSSHPGDPGSPGQVQPC